MRFDFNNLGGIDSGSVTPGDLTIICGPNNVGKTYVSYSIYGLLRDIESLVEIPISEEQLIKLRDDGLLTLELKDLLDNFHQYISDASSVFSDKLHQFFNVSKDFFKKPNTEFVLSANEFNIKHAFDGSNYFGKSNQLNYLKHEGESHLSITYQSNGEDEIPLTTLGKAIVYDIKFYLLNQIVPNPFIVSSERTGIALFYKGLDTNKNEMMRYLYYPRTRDSIEYFANQFSRYASPIQNNIDVIRDYEVFSKQNSFIKNSPDRYGYVTEALRELMGGKYETIDNQVMYVQDHKPGQKEVTVPVYIASSSIKSLFLIDLYINSIAQKGGMLIIDEPELNLHPDNQRKMAGLLTRLVNAGVKVLITTHSDYIIREINNRIMLNSDFDDKAQIMGSANLSEHDILRPEQVKAYSIKDDRKINDVEVDKYGINMSIFDDLIADANELADKIYYGIEE